MICWIVDSHYGDLGEIVGVALFLASDLAAYLTGSCVVAVGVGRAVTVAQ